jgi:TonB family protein
MRHPLLIALFTIALTPLAAAQTDGEAPLQLAEKMPVWSTCINATDQATCTAQAVATFVAERVSYDRKMKKRGLEGTVIVRFVVERDGSIGDIEIVRGIDPALDDQVVDAVRDFPSFKPGEQRGKQVRVQYALPVRFSL